MTTNTVKVVSVIKNHEQEKKDGGTYTCTLLTYTDQGKNFNKPFHNTVLERNEPLARALHSLKPGDCVKLTQVKNAAGYWNVTGIEKTTEESKGGSFKPTQRGSFADNAIGQQVGNALTNAVNMMAANCTEVEGMMLVEAARHVIRVGEQLKSELTSGTVSKKETVKSTKKFTSKKKVVEPEDEDSDIEPVEDDEEIEY